MPKNTGLARACLRGFALMLGGVKAILRQHVNQAQPPPRSKPLNAPSPLQCQNVAQVHFHVLEGPGHGLHVKMILQSKPVPTTIFFMCGARAPHSRNCVMNGTDEPEPAWRRQRLNQCTAWHVLVVRRVRPHRSTSRSTSRRVLLRAVGDGLEAIDIGDNKPKIHAVRTRF